MKHGWEIKKLGEVCVIERGGSPRPIQSYLTDDPNGLNWIKIGDAVEGSKYIVSTKERIIPEGLKKTRFVHKGDFLLSNSMSFGRPYILAIDGCIHDGWLVIHDADNRFDKSFLYYYLSSKNIYAEFKRLAVGGVVNNLNSELVRNVNVSIPPLSEQERIVEELDLLSGIIEKQKQQLKEYDTLAQSIFYTMFGDPITNEKGWEVQTLNDVCDVRDGTHDSPKYLENSDYLLITSKNITEEGKIDFSTANYISKNDYDSINKRSLVECGDIIMAMIGTIGKPIIVQSTKKNFCVKNVALIKFAKSVLVSNIYIQSLLNSSCYISYVKSLNKGGTQKFIPLGVIRKLPIPVPPLSLQQEFATKIEAIEKQKELIKQSLVEIETLFNSRMDYYFN